MADISDVFGSLNSNAPTNQMPANPQNTTPPVKNHNESFMMNANANQLNPLNDTPNLSNNQTNSNENPDNNDAIQKIQNEINKQKKINELKNELNKSKNSDSIMEKYTKKRKDVMKWITLSLVGVLALSLHDLIRYNINRYLTTNDVSQKNEHYLRILVPLIIVFLIWTLKVNSK